MVPLYFCTWYEMTVICLFLKCYEFIDKEPKLGSTVEHTQVAWCATHLTTRLKFDPYPNTFIGSNVDQLIFTQLK
jgi:hypothetical protein